MVARDGTGQRLRDEGMDRAERAEADVWKALASNCALRLAAAGEPFSIDDIIEAVGRPSRPNATGAIIMGLARRDLIVRVGVTTSRRTETHAHTNPLWQGTEQARRMTVPDLNSGPSASHNEGESGPHPYSPDYQAMGDCKTCGRERDDPLHPPVKGPDTRPRCPKCNAVVNVTASPLFPEVGSGRCGNCHSDIQVRLRGA